MGQREELIQGLQNDVVVRREKVDIEEELKMLERRDKKRRRREGEDSEEGVEGGDGAKQAVKRAALKRRWTNRGVMAKTRYSRSNSQS